MKNLICIIALLFFVPQLFAQSFEPGVWKTKESISINGLPLPASQKEECITAAQAADAKATLEKELKKQGCSMNKWNVKNQKLDGAITCSNDNFAATGKIGGAFSRKSYDLKGEAQGTFKGALPAVAQIALSGQWLRACPK